jgi:hypothetical protein
MKMSVWLWLERMPADDLLVCERACNLRTTRNVGEHCQFFIYNGETRECQLLSNSTKTCYMELGPALDSRACFFSKLQFQIIYSISVAKPHHCICWSSCCFGPPINQENIFKNLQKVTK